MADHKRTKIGATGPINVHRDTGSQSAAPASGTPAPLAPGTSPSNHPTSYLPPQVDPLIGQTIVGRYAIHKKLGEGGMGAVYLATHNLLEKQVALKVLHGEFARKADLVERFMQEAKSASRIRHENVIDISDFGTTPEGLVFFAMELLQGHDLHEEIARARLAGQLLPWLRSKKIFLQICSALTAAHEKGIVHRDLKPENVYLIDFVGEPDFVKLLDFGIAKLTEVEDGGRKLTKTGMLFGTPEYMSPEQARGENVDLRVDVYAMGCILFQLVTGRVPFEADNFMGVLSLHLTEPAPSIPLDVFDRIGAPRELAGVIDKALQKDRDHRFSTIEELSNAMRTVSGDPIPTRTTGSSPPRHGHASVAAPATTTTPRVRTQWTGSVQMPEEEDERAPKAGRSKLPLILGSIVVAAGAAGAGLFVMQGRKHTTGLDGPGTASGSAALMLAGSGSQIAIGSGSQTAGGGSAVQVMTPSPELPPLTGEIRIKLTSKPIGAEVRNVANGNHYGITPITLRMKASRNALSLSLSLKGYSDMIVDLIPDQDTAYVAPLEKGEAGTAKHQTIVKPTVAGAGAGTGSGSAVTVKHPPDAGSAATPSEAGSAVTAPEPGSATKPTPPPPDDELPVIKTNIPELKNLPGAGSGSGR